jgi:predicted enzyme related to lactoylglutathione lyase/predicted SnoaL-like aldol condensation-catalyzing enzyme
MKNFTGICLITPDMKGLCNFYCEVLQGELIGDEVSAMVTTQGAALYFFHEAGMDGFAPGCMQGAGRGASTLEFEVEDVDYEFERLVKLGVPVVKPPETYPWGRRSAWFRDPDGNIINFHMPVGVDRRSSGERVREYFRRLINEKDLSVCAEMLGDEYIDHDAPQGTSPGPRKIKEYAAGFLEDYPDMHVEIDELMEEKNRVAARIMWHGTHKTTGEVFHKIGIVMIRMNEQGKFVERWSGY